MLEGPHRGPLIPGLCPGEDGGQGEIGSGRRGDGEEMMRGEKEGREGEEGMEH